MRKKKEGKIKVRGEPKKISEKWYYILKVTAMFLMMTDHTAQVLYQTGAIGDNVCTVLRMFGVVSLPLYLYLMIQSFWHTKDRGKHLGKLLLLGLLSEFPYDLALTIKSKGMVASISDMLSKQNILFTTAMGFAMLMALEDEWKFADKFYNVKAFRNITVFFGKTITFAFFFGMAGLLNVDYGYNGIIMIFIMNIAMKKQKHRGLHYFIAMIFFLLFIGGANIEYYTLCVLALIPIMIAEKKSANENEEDREVSYTVKGISRFFYPLHLALLAFIKIFSM